MGLTRVYLWYSEVGGFDSHIGIRAWVVVFLPRYGYSFSAGKLRTLTGGQKEGGLAYFFIFFVEIVPYYYFHHLSLLIISDNFNSIDKIFH